MKTHEGIARGVVDEAVGQRTRTARRRLSPWTLVALTPWLCLGATSLLALIFGTSALDLANANEFAALLSRVSAAQRGAEVATYLAQLDPYFVTVTVALLVAGAVLVQLERRQRRMASATSSLPATPATSLRGWRFFQHDGVARESLLAVLAIGGLVLAAHAFVRQVLGWQVSTTAFFPIGVYQPILHATGLPYALSFLAVIAWAWCRGRPSGFVAWTCGLLLLFLGNLIQGGWFVGFLTPLQGTGEQYLHDALRIEQPLAWLAGFNAMQTELHMHAVTHPPFAVLLHYALWSTLGVSGLAIVFVLVASLSVPVLVAIGRELGLERDSAYRLGLLLAVVPAFNVYGALCLDGVTLTLATIGLWGLVRLERGRRDGRSVALFTVGLVGTNLVTFAGTILIGVALVVALLRLRSGNSAPARGLLVALGVGLVFAIGLDRFAGYDHVAAFATASASQNPGGFLFLRDVREFVVTRVENVAEILLFLSPGILALCLSRRARGTAALPGGAVALAGVSVLLAAFLTGAFRTGETARACLFVYPYLLLFVRGASLHAWTTCALLAALQTVVMQLTGSFFW